MKKEQIIKIIRGNLLVISILFIIAGFVVMSIGSSNPDSKFSFHQITLAPILLLMGYSFIIFAIMNRKN